MQRGADTQLLPPGYVITGVSDPGVAATFRLIQHAGGQVVEHDSSRSVSFFKPAKASWFAWYSQDIASNGWQPYDQPHACAYLPVAYDQLAPYQTDNGLLLLQNGGRDVSSVTVMDRDLWLVETSVSSLLARLGDVLADACVCLADQEDAAAFVCSALAANASRMRSAS